MKLTKTHFLKIAQNAKTDDGVLSNEATHIYIFIDHNHKAYVWWGLAVAMRIYSFV